MRRVVADARVRVLCQLLQHLPTNKHINESYYTNVFYYYVYSPHVHVCSNFV